MAFTVNGVIFAALGGAGTSGQFDLNEFNAAPYKAARAIYHPIGVTGSYTVGGGRTERSITAAARYIAANVPTLRGQISAHRDAWTDTPITILGSDGVSYKRCFLQSIDFTRNPRYGNGTVFADVKLSFIQYGDET